MIDDVFVFYIVKYSPATTEPQKSDPLLMTPRHRIRLAGPWNAEILDSDSHRLLAGQSLKMRCIDADSDTGTAESFSGTLRAIRKFNCPSGLEEQSKVWLCVDFLEVDTGLWLNDQPLVLPSLSDHTTRLEFEVSQLLSSFNTLAIKTACPPTVALVDLDQSIKIVAAVCLEIEA